MGQGSGDEFREVLAALGGIAGEPEDRFADGLDEFFRLTDRGFGVVGEVAADAFDLAPHLTNLEAGGRSLRGREDRAIRHRRVSLLVVCGREDAVE